MQSFRQKNLNLEQKLLCLTILAQIFEKAIVIFEINNLQFSEKRIFV